VTGRNVPGEAALVIDSTAQRSELTRRAPVAIDPSMKVMKLLGIA